MRNLLILFLSVFVLFSCNKDEVFTETENVIQKVEKDGKIEEGKEGYEVHYLLNGVEVSKDDLDVNNEDIYIAITGFSDKGNNVLYINGFSDIERYILWGKENNYPVKLSLEIEEHLSRYAEENGVIEEYEKTGIVSDAYLEYEAAYYEKIVSNMDNTISRGTNILHKDCRGDTNAPLVRTLPFMWPGWNNEVSAYTPLSVYSGLAIYDRSFYRRRMATLWNFGWTIYCFNGPLGFLDDRMSSAISL